MAAPSPLTVEAALADPQLFRAWLEQQRERQFPCRSLCHCPLAEYLSDSCRIFADVGYALAGFLDQERRPVHAPLPMWARQVVGAIDGLTLFGRGVAYVSAPEALRILDEVLAAAEVPS